MCGLLVLVRLALLLVGPAVSAAEECGRRWEECDGGSRWLVRGSEDTVHNVGNVVVVVVLSRVGEAEGEEEDNDDDDDERRDEK